MINPFYAIKSKYLILFFSMFSSLILSCQNTKSKKTNIDDAIVVGAERTELYINYLKNKKVAIVANQTSQIKKLQRAEIAPNVMGSEKVEMHLVDFLHQQPTLKITKVFAPEHGFRGDADAGELIKNSIDKKTNLPIISLYGNNKKPTQEQLKDVEIMLFDIQDVGVRFYTYISSLHYVMEACAEAKIPLIVLDRPNPNAHYIDGPVLEKEHSSFVGMHPVPVVYGLTIGEYAQMINGENWLKNGVKCDVTVIPIANYNHQKKYTLPIKPSPNLPNDKSINLYPSLCFFEGTNVSVGRGTDMQFQVYGSPYLKDMNFTFTPKPNIGAKNPLHENKVCFGEDLRENNDVFELKLTWLIKAYQQNKSKEFFNPFFTKLAGTQTLQQQIEQGLSENEIKKTWLKEVNTYKKIRDKYLIYK